MFFKCLSLLLFVALCQTKPMLRLKTNRMGSYGGYGGHIPYEPMSSYGDDSYGEDLLSDFDSHDMYGGSYGGSSYGDSSYGSYGGGFGSYAPMVETDYTGGYGKPRRSYKPKISYKKSYEMQGMKSYGSPRQYAVKVPNEDSPVKVLFLTQHTPVHIQQKHKKGAPEIKKATTHEEPHVVVHEVIKPVIQEIREIIVPFRKVIQKIEPVQEERKTIVAKAGEDKEDNEYKSSYDNNKKEEEKYLSRLQINYKRDEKEEDNKYDMKYEPKYETKYDSKRDYDGYKNDRQGETLSLTESQMSQLSHLSQGGALNGLTLAQIFSQMAQNAQSSSASSAKSS